jgi:hypothetical protein
MPTSEASTDIISAWDMHVSCVEISTGAGKGGPRWERSSLVSIMTVSGATCCRPGNVTRG